MRKILSLSFFLFVNLFAITHAQTRLAFHPSTHGFHFTNQFRSTIYFNGSEVARTDGLCGGMVLAAFNYFRYNMPIPNLRDDQIDFNVNLHLSLSAKSNRTPLVDYLVESQMATFTNVSAK